MDVSRGWKHSRFLPSGTTAIRSIGIILRLQMKEALLSLGSQVKLHVTFYAQAESLARGDKVSVRAGSQRLDFRITGPKSLDIRRPYYEYQRAVMAGRSSSPTFPPGHPMIADLLKFSLKLRLQSPGPRT